MFMAPQKKHHFCFCIFHNCSIINTCTGLPIFLLSKHSFNLLALMDDKTASKNISSEGDKLMEELVQTLPQEKNWVGYTLYQYQGFWYPLVAAKAIISFQSHFKAHDTDIFLITTPKSGTTWLKALIFSIVNRKQFPHTQSPLLTTNPHDLVPFIEEPSRPIHLGLALWYWKMSLEHPEKVLFLKYEDLKEDIASNLKTLADFLGYPFSEEEIRQGVVEEISKLCSFETLKSLEVNVTGERPVGRLKNSAFFRNGKVGDWVNFISQEMADRMKQLSEERYGDSGLKFDLLDKKA
ncbi:Sulfotransferase 2A [Theobroma cacao]|uniref:Sulfotransferase n=1 Tax=Theobroma cacao TaxID=3641 RepID=A0A061F869_THECC|nr:Sulfotransferase 2A [Theobroma cacao]